MESKDIEKCDIKKKKPGFCENFLKYLCEYSDNTTIHGVRYLGEKRRFTLERIIWFIILAVSLYLCIGLIVEAHEKWKNSPVIVSFAKSPTPVWQIPFPAITICPETKAKQRVYNFTEQYHKYKENRDNMTDEELREFEQASLVCDSHRHTDGNVTVSYESINFLKKIAPQFTDVLWQCKWLNENHTCNTLLSPLLTEEGICFTFNMLDKEDIYKKIVVTHGNISEEKNLLQWSLEEGYTDDLGTNTFPKRALGAGQQTDFSLLMTLYEQDLDFICKGALQGFKILLHNPAEMPRVGQQYFRASLNQETVVTIMPEMMTTSESLRDYDSESRQCYFPSERYLRFYQHYTQRNCELECLTNQTFQSCGCVAFYMPRDNETLICGSGSLQCIENAQTEMLAKEVESSIDWFEGQLDAVPRCNCLPSCTSLSYNAQTCQADFNWPKVFEAYHANFSEFPGVAMTRLIFYFREQQFITSERNELYGLTDFLANCGGLFGLFIGFSFLSIVEIVYYLTLRVCCNVKKYGCRFWSGPNLYKKHNN